MSGKFNAQVSEQLGTALQRAASAPSVSCFSGSHHVGTHSSPSTPKSQGSWASLSQRPTLADLQHKAPAGVVQHVLNRSVPCCGFPSPSYLRG
eukprot:CAMPEP_0179086400 /NCGR_PEP_ID=MMETSP0796-20121207/39190_1 /TAXON_ID=73915 /ORGANISM="Pyrodinium bahamense, Strain pbaha01" /LENGTH=92 /DNA_ID=CAMNT_0020783869 /DNA_START=195 /DNA_END=473 /DNA_ORIENTATION=-